MKKIISLLSTLVVATSMFAAFATTSFAAPVPESSKPEIQGNVNASLDSKSRAVLEFKLINTETLGYEEDEEEGTITSNGVNVIQAKITLDSNVFNVSESIITKNSSISASVSGKGTASLNFVFAPTDVGSYMTTVPAYLFQIKAPLKEGYTLDNIPNNAVTFGECIVEYTAYTEADISSDKPSAYTIYAVNGPDGAKLDYPLTVKFNGTAKDDDGNRVVTTTDNIDVSGLTHPYFQVDLKRGDGVVESNNFWLPTTNGVYGGKTYVRPILKYTIGEGDTDPQKNDKFEMKLYDWVDGAAVDKGNATSFDVK